MELKGKKVTVLGLGRSGMAAAELLLKKGADVFLTEKQSTPEISEKAETIRKMGADVEIGQHSNEKALAGDVIVKSPGIPMESEIISMAFRKRIEVIDELELASRFMKGRIIAVTGSNGKSTTASIIQHILVSAGKKSVLCGNIGYPAAKAVMESPDSDYFVTEVSSYQLEALLSFKPFIAVLTNITPDHLERHGTVENYATAKSRIFMNQTDDEHAVFNGSDRRCVFAAEKSGAKKYRFGWTEPETQGAFMDGDKMILKLEGYKRLFMSSSETVLRGDHNTENIMAAVVASSLCGMNDKIIKKGICSFEGLEHRLEFVTDISGILFYNDSKATNEDSSVKSLKSFPEERNIVLVLGGRDKGSSYESLLNEVRKKVKRLVLIGENREKLENIFSGTTELISCGSMEEAVVRGSVGLKRGDIFLLAPACASFDMFRDFEERGKLFKEAVKRLKEGVNG